MSHPFVPRVFTKTFWEDGAYVTRTEVADTRSEEIHLIWDGWKAGDPAPLRDPFTAEQRAAFKEQMGAEAERDGSPLRTSLNATFGTRGANVARFVGRARAGENLRITALGDSILEGNTVTNPATDGTMKLLAADLSARFGVTVTETNRASSGFTALRSYTDGRVNSAITDNADLYIVSAFDKNDLGAEINGVGGLYAPGYPEAQSLAAIERMVRTIRRDVPKADIIILATNPYVSGSSSNTYQQAKDRAVRRVAAAYGAEYVDAFTAFTSRPGGYADLMADSTHPNTAGHRVIADTILAHLADTDRTPIMPGAPAVKGLYSPQHVSEAFGNYGTVVSLVTGTDLSGAGIGWANTGSWTGTGGSDAYTTSTPGAYAEVTGRFSEVAFLMSTALADAPVLDVTVDGTVVAVDQSFTIGKNGNYYVPVAIGLDPATTHTVRLTVKSGTLKLQRAAMVATGAAAGAFAPETQMVDLGTSTAATGLPTDGTYTTAVLSTTVNKPAEWGSFDMLVTGFAMARVNGETTTVRQVHQRLRFASTASAPVLHDFGPVPAGETRTTTTAIQQSATGLTANTLVRLDARLLSTDKTNGQQIGYALTALLIRRS